MRRSKCTVVATSRPRHRPHIPLLLLDPLSAGPLLAQRMRKKQKSALWDAQSRERRETVGSLVNDGNIYTQHSVSRPHRRAVWDSVARVFASAWSIPELLVGHSSAHRAPSTPRPQAPSLSSLPLGFDIPELLIAVESWREAWEETLAVWHEELCSDPHKSGCGAWGGAGDRQVLGVSPAKSMSSRFCGETQSQNLRC